MLSYQRLLLEFQLRIESVLVSLFLVALPLYALSSISYDYYDDYEYFDTCYSRRRVIGVQYLLT
jgi:hypothetical protein